MVMKFKKKQKSRIMNFNFVAEGNEISILDLIIDIVNISFFI
jgi:hypothetical protein